MTATPHMLAAFAKIDREADAFRRAMFVNGMLQGAHECSTDPWSRGITLERQKIQVITHDEAIAALREILRRNDEVFFERGRGFLAPATKWWLCGALIAEGRLRRDVVRTAAKFSVRAA